MKKLLFLLMTVTSLFLSGCVSTNSNNDTFSTAAKTKAGGMVISTDDFTGTKTVVHKDLGYDFMGGLSGADVFLEPYFIFDNNSSNFFLKVQYDYFGNEIIKVSKIILLGGSEKVTINITGEAQISENKLASGSVLGKRRIITYSETISKEDYVKLSAFFENNATIRMGFYTTNNKAQELKEYSKTAHTIFSDAYAYYKENIESIAPTPTSDVLIFQ